MATVTVLTSEAAAGRLRALRHAGLVLVALFLAHELAYLARFADTARTATLGNEAGHAYWPASFPSVAVRAVSAKRAR